MWPMMMQVISTMIQDVLLTFRKSLLIVANLLPDLLILPCMKMFARIFVYCSKSYVSFLKLIYEFFPVNFMII